MEKFSVGQVFENIDDAKSAISDLNKYCHSEFIVDTNNNRSIVFICKHGKKRKFTGSGKRPNQHYNYLGCPARINYCINEYKGRKMSHSTLRRLNSPTTMKWTNPPILPYMNQITNSL